MPQKPNHPAKILNPKRKTQDYHAQAVRAEAQEDWKTAAQLYAQAVEQRAAELSLITSVQEGLSSRLEMQAIYDLVGDKLRDTFNAQVVMISQYDPATKRVFHHYALERGRHLNIRHWSPIDSSRAEIVRTRRPLMINLAEILKLLNAEKMHVIPGTELPKTWLGVPMLVQNEVRGIVSLQNLDIENAFSPSDIDLLATLTNSMSLSLENARLFSETQRLLHLLEQEMEIARQTQQSILPMSLPKFAGYDFGSLMIPAQAVGGDFYDFIHLDRDHLGIVVGDVSDKGLPAALFMALTFSLLRSEAGRAEDSRQILLNVNRYLLNMNASGMFVTLLYGVLHLRTGCLEYSRAGHLPPIILDSDGQVLEVPISLGQPLGIFPNVKIDQQRMPIPHGGLTLLYSDGLNEACDPQGKEFGCRRVRRELAAHRASPAREICQQLWRAVQNHSGENLHQDDFTAVLIKRI